MNRFTTKGNIMSSTRAYRFIAAALIFLSSAAVAQTPDRSAADAALIDRVKEAVIKELRESGALEGIACTNTRPHVQALADGDFLRVYSVADLIAQFLEESV